MEDQVTQEMKEKNDLMAKQMLFQKLVALPLLHSTSVECLRTWPNELQQDGEDKV